MSMQRSSTWCNTQKRLTDTVKLVVWSDGCWIYNSLGELLSFLFFKLGFLLSILFLIKSCIVFPTIFFCYMFPANMFVPLFLGFQKSCCCRKSQRENSWVESSGYWQSTPKRFGSCLAMVWNLNTSMAVSRLLRGMGWLFSPGVYRGDVSFVIVV